MKTDARVRYTRQALKDALLKLMQDKPVKKITVKEVCETAGLNRATFYTHYTDCIDLLGQIENELLDEFAGSLRYLSVSDATELIGAVYDMIEHNRELCGLLIFGHGDDSLIRKMIAITHDASIENWKVNLPRATESDRELLFTCLSNGLMHVVLEGYPKYDRKTLTTFVNTTLKSCMSAYR